MSEALVCIYRISDFAQNNTNKAKLTEATKQACLLNFIKVFGKEKLYIIADCVSEENLEWLATVVSADKVIKTSYKSGAFSFMYGVQTVLRSGLPSNTIIYFVEDDYIHRSDSRKVLLEGLKMSDYVSLYDHPDKYDMYRNPSEIYVSPSCHWRSVLSTTMTFATRVKTIQEDKDIYHAFCKTGYPYDHHMFLELHDKKKRKLITPIPSRSTHVELAYLAPLVGNKAWVEELE